MLACVAAGGWPGGDRLAVLSVTMLAIQFAIGALNDWADRELDARSKPSKPIAAGLVSPAAALTTALLLSALAAILAATDGGAAWALAMTGLAVGVAYDLGLKRTPFSALTYAIALPLLPLWVWTALSRTSGAVIVVAPLGMLLGCALQLANALPDAAGDSAGGVRGTLQWLGPTWGRRVCWSAFGAALALALLLAPRVDLTTLPFVVCWAGAALALAGAILTYRLRPSIRSLQTGWTLLAPGAALLAIGWFASLP